MTTNVYAIQQIYIYHICKCVIKYYYSNLFLKIILKSMYHLCVWFSFFSFYLNKNYLTTLEISHFVKTLFFWIVKNCNWLDFRIICFIVNVIFFNEINCFGKKIISNEQSNVFLLYQCKVNYIKMFCKPQYYQK